MSEEEKNLEEIDLLKEAEESEEEIREETPEEEREPLTPEDLKDVRDLLDEVRELRGGLRGAADPHMIQKHLDNFLAALCGETPVDSNVRTSTEYWLKRLADGEGGSTKKIYVHHINASHSGDLPYIAVGFDIFNNDPTPFTKVTLKQYLDSTDRTGPITGSITETSGIPVINAYTYRDGSNNLKIYGSRADTGANISLTVAFPTLIDNYCSITDTVVSLN